MSGFRLAPPHGTLIDRTVPLRFAFNGRDFEGFQGDTLASALLANGVRTVARSYKFHRPRGIYSCGPEESAAIVETGADSRLTPNTKATQVVLTDGLQARSGPNSSNLAFDMAAIIDRLAALIPAGFYYKTFIWPSWHLFEPFIRTLAAPSLPSSEPDPDRYDTVHAETDVLVIGGGASGSAAALSAADSGARVTLIHWGPPGRHTTLSRAGVRVLTQTLACGIYDHLLVAAVETPATPSPIRERLHKIRARRLVLATGALERPMVFPDNDRPGVMLATAVARYADRYAVACGRRAVLAVNADYAYPLAAALHDAGIAIGAIIDRRDAVSRVAQAALPAGIEVLTGAVIVSVRGSKSVKAVTARDSGGLRREIEADLVCSAGGAIPNIALWAQAGGKSRWVAESSLFVPEGSPAGVSAVGACAGLFDPEVAISHAQALGRALARGDTPPDLSGLPVGRLGPVRADTSPGSSGPARSAGKSFVDLRNDVTTLDIDLAVRENYRSVEHLKRYTTSGMGTDQGKTANVNALVQLAVRTGRTPAQVGTTKFRPPYVPITLGVLAAGRGGARLRPLKHLPAEAWHLAQGARMGEYGTWLRPSCYPRQGETLQQAARREAIAVRSGVGLFDGSPLGKLQIHGPDAARFLDWMYLRTLSTLKVGQLRWGVLLNDNGVLIDDGVVGRLGDDSFWVNTSSANAERVVQHFEEWLQRELTELRVSITPVSWHWANITVAGPRAWELLSEAAFAPQLAPQAMPHMTMRSGEWNGLPLRVLRASFCGELSYEINVPARHAVRLYQHLFDAGRALEAQPYGIEALDIMRTEKGFIHIGGDTDGVTFPGDVGLGGAVSRKQSDFVGRRSLDCPTVRDPQRMQLVGLVPADLASPLPVGAHITDNPPPSVSQGYITSSCYSDALGHPIALARLMRGRERLGERLKLFNMGNWIEADVVALPFLDPQGERLRGY